MKRKILFYWRNIIRIVIAVGGILLCLRYASECARGILNGILFCIEVLVPSLFLVMTAAAYLIRSGTAELITKPFGGISKALFGLPAPSLAVILAAMVGGYPVGARCAAMLYERGALSEKQAEKTAMIAVCAGPGFTLNFIGRALLGSPPAGVILLAAQIPGALLTGLVIGRMTKCDDTILHNTSKNPQKNLLVGSVADASRATFHMCAMVVLCAAMIEVITTVSSDRTLTDIASALVEITTGCSMLCGHYPLAFIAFFVGFGGISVHLQIYAAVGDLPLRKGVFFLYRILQGIITAGITYSLLLIFPVEFQVFNSAELPLSAAQYATAAGSAALILSSLCFLGSVNKMTNRIMNRR